MRKAAVVVAATLTTLLPAAIARADFPYSPGGDPHRWGTLRAASGVTPNDFSESDWKLSATPDSAFASPLTTKVNNQQDELCGIRGMSVVDKQTTQPSGGCAHGPVRTAWQVSTGRPDVVIDVLDSGIKWNDLPAMTDLRAKVHLNQGELPAPRHDLGTPLVGSKPCSTYSRGYGGNYNRHGAYDVNGDGVFNVLDYACDSRVGRVVNGGSPRHALRHGPPGFLTPEDLILAFSDGKDHDRNGFANDIAGWNFVDNNNDPFDDVQYGHGTGEALDSNAEANNGGDVGTCPNCEVVPLRVGESFVADANRFGQAVMYATDNGASVVQEALGSLNAPNFARQAIEYAYHHGVTVIASAADEAAEHHNQPGALPDTIVVNSVVKYDSQFTFTQPSYLQFNGCTNFGTRIVVAVPSSSCSSEATGKSAGVAGLIYSAAENARGSGVINTSGGCRRVDGSRCVITPNEVRQLMASGNIGGLTPADNGTAQADDVNFAAQPEGSCATNRTASCTDPNKQITFAPDQSGGVVGPIPHTTRYPARKGYDEFYGYGRLNAYKAVQAVAAGTIPPEADITSPDWFQQINPSSPYTPISGHVSARTAYRCEVDVAPGAQQNNARDFQRVGSSWCDGASVHVPAHDGVLGYVDTNQLKSRFPPRDFAGNANAGGTQDSNGRPNTLPYAFTVRVLVWTATGTPMSGEDRRQLFLHRDSQMLPHFPIELRSDGDSSPLLADIDGDNRNELIVATSDGRIHAYRPNGRELPGWPVHTLPLPMHRREKGYRRGGVGTRHYAAVLGGLAAGDLFGDGRIEVVADDNQGNVYAWDQKGHYVFHQVSNPRYSGTPLRPFHTVRQGVRDRVERGFLGSPVLANLQGGRGLDVIVAGEDRHVYAWGPHGHSLKGFPVLVADPDKVASVNPVTHHITFRNVSGHGLTEDQGKIIDTPAVAYLGKTKHPSIIVGTNEEYPAGEGDEGQINAGFANSIGTSLLGKTGLLTYANGRVYAIKPDGHRGGSPFQPGWPVKVGIIDAGLLPDVGEGVNGSPVVASFNCPSGGPGAKIGVLPDAGPAYVFNANGSSCYGRSGGADNTLQTDVSLNTGKYDTPVYAAVGYPAFGTLDNKSVSLFAPTTGLIRALDVVAPEYQGGQDFLGGWNPSSANGSFLSGYPAEVNDLQFLTGPAVGQITPAGGQQVLGGTASLDLQAFSNTGAAPDPTWPKLTGDWTVATPTLGSFGTKDTSPGARKDVVSITRSGTLSVYGTPAPACSPSSSPRFHHDDANSGDYSRDAIAPGKPTSGRIRHRRLTFTAPGGDLLCGKARSYQLVTSNRPITAKNFGRGRHLHVSLAPAQAGTRQTLALPRRLRRYVALRAVDDAGNLGRPLVLKVRR